MSEESDLKREANATEEAPPGDGTQAQGAAVADKVEPDLPQETFGSPWLEYLGGKKKRPAEQFLKQLEKSGYTEPGEDVVSEFGCIANQNPDRLPRVIELVRTSRRFSRRTRKSVEGLGAGTLVQLGLGEAASAEGPSQLNAALQQWIDSQDRPLQTNALAVLMLALALGHVRELASEQAVVALMESALARPGKPGAKKRSQPGPPDPIDVILSANPTPPGLRPLTRLSRSKSAQVFEFEQRISSLEDAKAGLEEERATLLERVASLEQELASSHSRIAELTLELDGYMHTLEDARGRFRGAMRGTLLRWLETALDAARAQPPFLPAIKERLEDAIELITKETE